MTKVTMVDHMGAKLHPAVSIGMPVYNGEKYLREALDTLLSQSYKDFELIISDNASTDATAIICKEYADKDPRIRYVKQTVNLGALANFTFVRDVARGEFFMWAAGDDKWDSNWISDMLETIKKTGVQAAFGKVQSIDELSCELEHPANHSSFEYRGSQHFRQLKYFLQFEGAGKANPIYALWKLSVLRDIQLNSYLYDYLIVFDLLRKTEIVSCGSSRIFKRIHSDSEGSGAPIISDKSLIATVCRIGGYLIWPTPRALILGYLQHAIGNRVFLITAIPLKYLLAYWFMISNSRIFLRKFP